MGQLCTSAAQGLLSPSQAPFTSAPFTAEPKTDTSISLQHNVRVTHAAQPLGGVHLSPQDHAGRLNAQILLTWGRGDLKLLKNLRAEISPRPGLSPSFGTQQDFLLLSYSLET